MPAADRPLWEITLRDAIAEEMAVVAERDLGVKGLNKTLGGLIDIFGCTPETRELGRRRLIRALNQDALNVAAKKWLPPDWGTDQNLYVLTLMLWGIWEANAVPDYWDALDIAGEQVANMTQWNPALVMAMLQGATAADLAEQDDAAGAAWILMSALAQAMRSENSDLLPAPHSGR